MRDPDCIFCKIVAGELPAQIVDEDERAIAFMDINPATRGHLLVVPREHTRNLLMVEPEDLLACAAMAQRMARRLSERLEPTGSTSSTRAARRPGRPCSTSICT